MIFQSPFSSLCILLIFCRFKFFLVFIKFHHFLILIAHQENHCFSFYKVRLVRNLLRLNIVSFIILFSQFTLSNFVFLTLRLRKRISKSVLWIYFLRYFSIYLNLTIFENLKNIEMFRAMINYFV